MLQGSSTLPALDATLDKLELVPNRTGHVDVVMLLLHSETSPAVVDAQHATIRLRGCLHARCFATERESWSVVAQELRDDVASSLRTRVALLCDELGDEAEAGSSKKQLLEKGVAGVEEWQLPRRVVAPLAPGLLVGDYMVPGEGRDECAERFMELLSCQVAEASIQEVEPFSTQGSPQAGKHEKRSEPVTSGDTSTGAGQTPGKAGGGVPFGLIAGALGAAVAGIAAFAASQ